MKNISNKKFFKNYGVLLLILVISFSLLIYISSLSKGFWKKKLVNSIQVVLDEKQPDSWTVGDFIKIENPLASSAACYELINNKNNKADSKVIILRIVTFYGPSSAVFILHDENNVEFVGYSNLHGRILKQLETNNSDARIEYWKTKILDLF